MADNKRVVEARHQVRTLLAELHRQRLPATQPFHMANPGRGSATSADHHIRPGERPMHLNGAGQSTIR